MMMQSMVFPTARTFATHMHNHSMSSTRSNSPLAAQGVTGEGMYVASQHVKHVLKQVFSVTGLGREGVEGL